MEVETQGAAFIRVWSAWPSILHTRFGQPASLNSRHYSPGTSSSELYRIVCQPSSDIMKKILHDSGVGQTLVIMTFSLLFLEPLEAVEIFQISDQPPFITNPWGYYSLEHLRQQIHLPTKESSFLFAASPTYQLWIVWLEMAPQMSL
ncbi:hypothetical protein Tco_0031582 [Tanacetum coccineum]